METDNGKGNFADRRSWLIFLGKSMCSKKDEIKELAADIDGGDCDAEGEIRDPKDSISLSTQ